MKVRVFGSEAEALASGPDALRVEFDAGAVAGQLGLSVEALKGRMLDVMVGALICDAIAIAAQDMRALGQTFGLDGTPAGFPVDYMAAVVRSRLYPESVN